ncbi:hypothetical protein [Micromonospora ureilytica]|uniref:hypothetical protein n=1 Tax=Micromonospora ureilytica TaxID=709868 RepID=UPI002E112C4E|nr:hypothetical protein OHB55_08015 [Micromonospora ureilytica]
MPYDEHYTPSEPEPSSPWIRRVPADVGIDGMQWTPDGPIAAFQYKSTNSRYPDGSQRNLQHSFGNCPECTVWRGPLHGDRSASNITVAASHAYFSGLDPAAVAEKMIWVVEDLEQHLNVGDLLRQLTPAPEIQVLVVSHPSDDHLPPHGVSGAPVVDGIDLGKVTRLLKHWNSVSQRDTTPQIAFEVLPIELLTGHLAVGTARCAVRAAYQARQAVVQNPVASEPIVARFAERWLGLRPTDTNIAATGNALLQAPLDGAHPDGDHAAVRRLRSGVRDQRRAWRLIGETELRGRKVDSLDRTLTNSGTDSPWTVADTVAGGASVDTVDGWNDPRLHRVLARLKPDELQVTMSKVLDGLTWSAAALACGKTVEFGERVRCKLKRLGAELTARIDAAAKARHQFA